MGKTSRRRECFVSQREFDKRWEGAFGNKKGKAMKCIKCGCTDDDCSGCVKAQGFPCAWVEPGKCSRCFCKCGAELKTETEQAEGVCCICA